MNYRLSLFFVFTAFLLAFLVGCVPITPVPDAGTSAPPAEATAAPMEEASSTATAEEAATPAETAQSAGLANPASQYCADQGGTLTIEKRGDGGEFGVCTFEDNLQCEEWAMMRGQCPVGGIKVTGYLTPAVRLQVVNMLIMAQQAKPMRKALAPFRVAQSVPLPTITTAPARQSRRFEVTRYQ
jgi:putative hemolysin